MSSRKRRKTAPRVPKAATRTAGLAKSQSPSPVPTMSDDARSERRSVLIFVGVLVLMVVASVVYAGVTDDSDGNDATGEMPGVAALEYRGGEHTDEDVDYAELPPAGGAHADVWQNCDFYVAPVIEEQAVHSLEHGAVWITYLPDLDRAQVSALEALAATLDHILVSPYPGLDASVVASAWNHQLRLESATDPRLTEFVRTFRLSSTAPEPGASCSGGSSDVVNGG